MRYEIVPKQRTDHIWYYFVRRDPLYGVLSTCDESNEKKSTVYNSGDEGCSKQSRCGQVHQNDKEILQRVR